ncbi:head-tail connector protein [bacterium]|nr:head-tail connector protein [bacterium]MDB4793019.1 head-tail connector protein [bacterium]
MISGPASEVVTLEQVKAHCRIVGSDQDDYLNTLIVVSRQYAEHYTQKVFGEQTWQLTAAKFPCQFAKPPLVSINWVKYYSDGVLTTWDSTEYHVDLSIPSKIVPIDSFPIVDVRPDAVQIQLVAGETAPEKIQLACLIMCSHWFESREPVVIGTIVAKIPWSAHALLDSEKWGDYS